MIANLQTLRKRPVRNQPLPCPVEQNLVENDVRIFWKCCKVMKTLLQAIREKMIANLQTLRKRPVRNQPPAT
jgi:hypothetical protein